MKDQKETGTIPKEEALKEAAKSQAASATKDEADANAKKAQKTEAKEENPSSESAKLEKAKTKLFSKDVPAGADTKNPEFLRSVAVEAVDHLLADGTIRIEVDKGKATVNLVK